jgi:ATP-dependent helicase Lhr and Lhr-like helicase
MITRLEEPYKPVQLKSILHPLINKWFFKKFEKFSLPQLYGVMEIHNRKNVLISAPTGATKCLVPEETVLINENGFAKLVTGWDLIRRSDTGTLVKKIGQSGRLFEFQGINSFSLKKDMKISPSKALIYYENTKDELLRIKTQYGREVKISKEHPLLVEDKGWVKAENLRMGDKIAVPSRISLPEKDVELKWEKALLNLREKAKVCLTYDDYLKVKRKTQDFRKFDHLTILENKKILAMVRLSYKDIKNELKIGITTAHRLVHKKTEFAKKDFSSLLSKKLQKLSFAPNRVIYKTYGTHDFSFIYPKKLDVKLARWISFILAEGIIGDYDNGTHLAISQKNKMELLQDFFLTSKEYFDIEFKKISEKDYAVYSTLFCNFVTDLFSTKKGRGRFVEFPDWLLNCKQIIKNNFLYVFFSLEATVTNREIKLTQSNKQKIEIINYLLLSNGILGATGKLIAHATNTINKIRREYYSITISQVLQLKKFLDLVGIDTKNRQKITGYLESKVSGHHVNKFKFDYKRIRELSRYYTNDLEFKKDFGSVYEVVRRTGYVTEEALLLMVDKLRKINFQDNLLSEIQVLLDMDIAWLRITSIKRFKYEGKVFDLTVPFTSNFVGGYGGIILHNTLTGFLSVLNELVDCSEKQILEDKVYCVYISPLKALNNDIEKNLREPLAEMEELAGKKLGIRLGVRTGDTTPYQKQKMLKNCPHILITTPESLAIMINSPKFQGHLKTVQWLIVDEIHAIADNKRGVHLNLTIERLTRISPGMCRVGLSATIAPLDDIAQYLVGYKGDEFNDCGIVDVQFIKQMDLQVLSPVKSLVDTDYMLKHKKMYELMHKLVEEHKTTVIFTNTRSGTERVVHNLKEMYPDDYGINNIAAHHGSLSKQNRFKTEEDLRQGNLKVVVSSTSLELGIDIGFVDLVLCLGSPKSVARFLQRSGRAGHQLHSTVKARIIVMDRDDLIECSLLLKSAKEKKIDRIHIPRNALDVLAQHIYGMAINEVINIYEMFHLIKGSYCYHDLDWKDFFEVIRFLAGAHVSLEERHVYARIWYDEKTGDIGKRGKMARIIYMTNIGTIPEESYVQVKIKDQVVGAIDEGFLERLKPGDVFVLGGNVYLFKFSRGMTAQVSSSVNRPPTVPSWFSEMLPLSFDLAMEINKFRRLMDDKLSHNSSKDDIIKWVHEYLYVDDKAAHSIYQYFWEQYNFSQIPSDRRIVIEQYTDRGRTYVIFDTLFGRRVNDCLSRALAFVIGRSQHRDVEVGISDNGFYLSADKTFNAKRAFDLLREEDFKGILEQAIERSEVLSRRFRHCAGRSLMILREYMGKKKGAGRMQIGSKILFNAVKRISNDFPILKEARREVMEDLMDYEHASWLVQQVAAQEIEVVEERKQLPSPFAFGLIMSGYSDVIKVEDKQEFLRRMHQEILARISLKQGKKLVKDKQEETVRQFSYDSFWDESKKKSDEEKDIAKEKLKMQVWRLKHVPIYAKEELIKLIEFGNCRKDVFNDLKKHKFAEWPEELKEFMVGKLKD